MRGAVGPAFVDAHQHAFLNTIEPSTDVLHGGIKNMAELLEKIRTLTTTEGNSTNRDWLRLHGYLTQDLAELRSPTASELDTVISNRPLHVISRSYHESAVNTFGLEILGIGPLTVDPPRGNIVRNASGQATGVLLDSASFMAESKSRGHLNPFIWRERIVKYAQVLLSKGITAVDDAAVPNELASDIIQHFEAEGIVLRRLSVQDDNGNVDDAAKRYRVEGRGILQLGVRADFVWLDTDPANLSEENFASIQVLSTWSNGRLRYTHKNLTSDELTNLTRII